MIRQADKAAGPPKLVRRCLRALWVASVMLWAPSSLQAESSASRQSGEDLALIGAPESIALTYQVYAGGLHIFTSASEVALDPAGYDVRLALQTDGWLAWLLDFSLDAEVAGEAGPTGLAPRRFRTDSSWRGRERWVQITYDDNGKPLTEAEPPPKEDDRDGVPEQQRAGTVDPITASLALLHRLQQSGRCDAEAAVFDGRRLFAATVTSAGEATLLPSDLAPFGGAVTACLLRVMPVSGFSKDPRYPPEPQEITIYLREVVAGWPPLPVRIESDTRFGALRAHLVSATPATAQKAAR